MSDKKKFETSAYLNISQDHLVVAALRTLMNDGRQPSFENLVAEAFTLFPERFKLEGYPDWPNAHVVGKAWVRCRTDKKWLTGSASQGFRLTPLGEQTAEKVLRQLGIGAPGKTTGRRGSRQTISSRVVLRLESSPAYEKYRAGHVAEVTEYEFCELLYCTLESTPETFDKNFAVLRQGVDAYGRSDLSNFLDELRDKFSGKFAGRRARGGLMPKRSE